MEPTKEIYDLSYDTGPEPDPVGETGVDGDVGEDVVVEDGDFSTDEVLDTITSLNPVIHVKGSRLDLSELKNETVDFLKEMGKDLGGELKDKIGPIVDWAKDMLTRQVPAIGKYYAETVGYSLTNKKGEAKIAKAKERVAVFISRIKSALKNVLKAIGLTFAKVAQAKIWEIIEKAVYLFVGLSKTALAYIAPGVKLG